MGGAEQSLVSLLNSIDLDKYNIDLLLFEKNGDLTERIPDKVNVMEADYITRAMLLEFRYYFKDLIKNRNYIAAMARVLMLLNSKLQILFNKQLIFNWHIAKHFIKKQEIKYDIAVGFLEGSTDIYVVEKVDADRKIGWIHTDFSRQSRNYKEEGKFYNCLDNIAIISEECENHFLSFYPEFSGKTKVIENITDRNLIVQKSLECIQDEFKIQGKTIVTVGRLEKEKGIDIALVAANILKNNNIDFTWHIFGAGILYEELVEKIEKFGLSDVFILEGVTKNPYKYMRAADIIVQPSRYEGKSIVLDEAKILAKPIVVTNYPSVNDQITDEITGMIVDIAPQSIADGIMRLINDKDLCKTLSRNCQQEEDKVDQIIGKIECILESE